MTDLAAIIDQAWEEREGLGLSTTGAVREAVEAAIEGLDAGTYRVAEKADGAWRVNQWLNSGNAWLCFASLPEIVTIVALVPNRQRAWPPTHPNSECSTWQPFWNA